MSTSQPADLPFSPVADEGLRERYQETYRSHHVAVRLPDVARLRSTLRHRPEDLVGLPASPAPAESVVWTLVAPGWQPEGRGGVPLAALAGQGLPKEQSRWKREADSLLRAAGYSTGNARDMDLGGRSVLLIGDPWRDQMSSLEAEGLYALVEAIEAGEVAAPVGPIEGTEEVNQTAAAASGASADVATVDVAQLLEERGYRLPPALLSLAVWLLENQVPLEGSSWSPRAALALSITEANVRKRLERLRQRGLFREQPETRKPLPRRNEGSTSTWVRDGVPGERWGGTGVKAAEATAALRAYSDRKRRQPNGKTEQQEADYRPTLTADGYPLGDGGVNAGYQPDWLRWDHRGGRVS